MIEAKELLGKLFQKQNLTASEAHAFLDDVFKGAITPVQTAAILTALRMKEESPDEIVGFVESMRSCMQSIKAPGAIDIVGTGGDSSGTFNISTAASFVAHGAGAKIAKHGNRAASSKCGSADVLETLGVKIVLTPEQAQKVFDAAGIVFLFAPVFHPSMKIVGPVRSELKIRTIFNLLGPFANPARTARQLIGVPNSDIAKVVATAAQKLGYKHVLIVTSNDGMDEITTSSKTQAFEIRGNSVRKFIIDPAKLGFKKASKSNLLGGSKEENAQIVRDILSGKKGPKRDIVVLNAAFGLYVAGAAKTPKEGIALAERSIDSGAAREALKRLVKESNAV